MANRTQLSKWGHSLAVRVPREVVKEAGLSDGDWLSLEVSREGHVTMRSARPKYELEQLVSGIKPSNRHMAADWGSPVGKEVW